MVNDMSEIYATLFSIDQLYISDHAPEPLFTESDG